MKAAITNTLVSQLKPTNKQYDVRDNKLKGFLIRVNPSGKMNYVCVYKRGRRINIGSVDILTPAQARERAKEILGDVVKGVDPTAVKKQSQTLSLKAFIENEYRSWVMTHRKTGVKTIARIRGCFYKNFADRKLAEITAINVEQWRTQKITLGIATETINRDIATFKAALSKAVEWGFIESHPLAKLKLFKTDTSAKIRYLNHNEEISLRRSIDFREERIKLERANYNNWRKKRNYPLLPDLSSLHFVDYIKPMILISLNTGLRQGELFNMKWCDINFDRQILTISGDIAKNGKTRHIPLNDEAFITLEKWYELTSKQSFIFQNLEGNKFNNVRKAWLNLLKTANIENFRWHDMRHHFASCLVMAGVDLNTVRELLGHSDIKMTLRYAHLAPEHKAAAVAKLSNRLQNDNLFLKI